MSQETTPLPVGLQRILLDVHLRLMTENTDIPGLLSAVSGLLAERLGYGLVWAALGEPGSTLTLRAVAGPMSADAVQLIGANVPRPRGRRGEATAYRCLREGRPVHLADTHSDPPFSTRPCAQLLLPLGQDDQPWGVLGVEAPVGYSFRRGERALLEQAARHTGFAIRMLERFDLAAGAAARINLAAAVFEHAQEGIFITDPAGRILAANPAVCRITGYGHDELVGATPARFRSGRHDPDFYHAFWQGLRDNGQWQGEIWNRRKNGEEFAQMLSVSAIRDEAGGTLQYVALLVDISAQKEVEARLARQAQYDELTGLPNRALFKDCIARALARARRDGDRLAVLFLDVDHFKDVNDTLGHQEGDRLLREVAQRLAACLRAEDVVARLGGDEFAVLLTHLSHMQDAAVVAHKLIEDLAAPIMLGARELHPSASIGIGLCPEDGEDMDDLLRRADLAMYAAKEQGRNGFQFYRPDMERDSRERLSLGNALRRALERQELFLHYQPQHRLEDGRVVGVEALLRWRDGDAVIPPARFIPVAEQTGLIVPIGEWVLHSACLQARAWRDAGLDLARVAVNLSGRQFRQRDLISLVSRVLEETGLPAPCLEIEITESVAMGRVTGSALTLGALKELGVRLAIDDFGTGYSSLAYLGQYPLDTLKIDASFVQRLGTDRRCEAIVRAIIGMARALDIEVVAEGVENTTQLAFLRAQGCGTAQGFLLGRPQPAGQLSFAHVDLTCHGTGGEPPLHSEFHARPH